MKKVTPDQDFVFHREDHQISRSSNSSGSSRITSPALKAMESSSQQGPIQDGFFLLNKNKEDLLDTDFGREVRASQVCQKVLGINESRVSDQSRLSEIEAILKEGSLANLKAFIEERDFDIHILIADSRTRRKECSLLHIAAKYKSKEICEYFVANGLDVNALNACGESVLLYFLRFGFSSPEFTRFLLDLGADPYREPSTKNRKNALWIVIRNRQIDSIVRFLTHPSFDFRKNIDEKIIHGLDSLPLDSYEKLISLLSKELSDQHADLLRDLKFELFTYSFKRLGKSIQTNSSARSHGLLSQFFSKWERLIRNKEVNYSGRDLNGNNLFHYAVQALPCSIFLELFEKIDRVEKNPVYLRLIINQNNIEGNSSLGLYLEKYLSGLDVFKLSSLGLPTQVWNWLCLGGVDFSNILRGNGLLHIFVMYPSLINNEKIFEQLRAVLGKEALKQLSFSKNIEGKSAYRLAKEVGLDRLFLYKLFPNELLNKDLLATAIQEGWQEVVEDVVQDRKQTINESLFREWLNTPKYRLDLPWKKDFLLTACVRNKNLEAFKFFLELGASWQIEDEDRLSLAYLTISCDFDEGLKVLIQTIKEREGAKGLEKLSHLGTRGEHIIFDAIRLQKYESTRLMLLELDAIFAVDSQFNSPIYYLIVSKEINFLELILRDLLNFGKITKEDLLKLLNTVHPRTGETVLFSALLNGNFKYAALLFHYGVNKIQSGKLLYEYFWEKEESEESLFFIRAFLDEISEEEIPASVDPDIFESVQSYQDIPGPVSLSFLLSPKKQEKPLLEKKSELNLEATFAKIQGMLNEIDSDVFEEIGAKRVGTGVKKKVIEKFDEFHRLARNRHPWLGTYHMETARSRYMNEQFYSEMVLRLSDIVAFLDQEPDVRSRALTLFEIIATKIEGRCAGALRTEILQAWELLRQPQSNGASNFQEIVNLVILDALKSQAEIFARNISINDPSREPHIFNQLLYLMGLTSIQEPLLYYSNSHVLGMFMQHLHQTKGNWLIDSFLKMIVEKNQKREFLSFLEDYIREDLNADKTIEHRKKALLVRYEEINQERLNTIQKVFQQDEKKLISLLSSYREEGFGGIALALKIEETLSQEQGKRKRIDEPLISNKKSRLNSMEESSANQELVDEKWKVILSAQKDWESAIEKLYEEYDIQASPTENITPMVAFIETQKTKRLMELADDEYNLETPKAARYFLKKFGVFIHDGVKPSPLGL
jgi:ankyrin repeat protein